MDQRGTTGAHADATTVAGVTTEFEPDVMDLLVKALRRAVGSEFSAVGTDTLLGELVLGDTEAGGAIAPGTRKAGSLSGMIFGRAGRGWVSDDEVRSVSAGAGAGAFAGAAAGGGACAGADEESHQEADEREVDAAWREARWRFGLGSRGSAAERSRALPGMTGAMRVCLLLALRAARVEGTISVRCRHVARALLDLPDTRAREALLLQRLDTAASATALDALDASAPAENEGPESRGVTLLRRAGTLGRSGNRLTRALTSWTSGASENGSPVLFAVTVEAVRQAVRRGRTVAEPVDLLLGTLALDRALSVAGRSLPGSLADANAAPALLRRYGVRQVSLVSSASATDSDSVAVPGGSETRLSAAADRTMAVARLSAAEHGSPTVGTIHLLSALLDDSATHTATATDTATRAATHTATATDTDADTATATYTATDTDTDPGVGAGGAVVRMLAADRVDIAALRAELRRGLGA
ncbi:hypothetical protein ACGF8B_38540 [Streptomyces sp. NPDC047917]|uniref:hypothetical protein n=1 Tax=Streptomyces sp. NPDC047917 TaxID=3365491 RepID=UPI003717412E